MRRPYLESASRFVFGLLFFGALFWLVSDRTGVNMAGLLPALKVTGVTAGLSVLYALPVAVLLSVPAGLRPGSSIDRLLQGATLVLAGISVGTTLALLGGVVPNAAHMPERELLAVSAAAPWLSRAIREGMVMTGPGGMLRACAGRLLQELGNLLVVTAPLQVLFVPSAGSYGLAAGIAAIAIPALVAHLAGDLLTAGMDQAGHRLPTSWVLLGGLMIAFFLAPTLLLEQGRDLLAPLAAGTRVSLFVAAGATLVAAAAGALLAGIGRALGPTAAATGAPRVQVPALLTVAVGGLALLLFRQFPGILWMMLLLGLASAPVAAYGFRRLLDKPGAGTARGLAGALLLVAAQTLFAEAALGALGLGVQPPVASLGGLVTLGRSVQTQGAYFLIPNAVLALGIGGLFLIGQALRESAGTDA